jgi:hypothetical protein
MELGHAGFSPLSSAVVGDFCMIVGQIVRPPVSFVSVNGSAYFLVSLWHWRVLCLPFLFVSYQWEVALLMQ